MYRAFKITAIVLASIFGMAVLSIALERVIGRPPREQTLEAYVKLDGVEIGNADTNAITQVRVTVNGKWRATVVKIEPGLRAKVWWRDLVTRDGERFDPNARAVTEVDVITAEGASGNFAPKAIHR